MTKLHISTRKFVNSHGRKPRGYGLWMFIVMSDEGNTEEVATFSVPTSTLTAARKAAAAYVKERWAAEFATGHLYLEVAP